ncbi:MAG: serine hydroxymethyltransferase [Rickettsiales bacterium]
MKDIGKHVNFFTNNYSLTDPDVSICLERELKRQQNQIELIASENIVSKSVMEIMGTVATNKYAEGYPNKRYYGGCEFVDEIENIAINRAKTLFDCEYANVQPHSGSQANQAVFLALLNPGDTILGMSLADGGHLTHGAAPNISGKWFNAIQYGIDPETGLIDYSEVEKKAVEHKPKLIIAGGSAYPRKIDFKKFREIANKVGAFLLADIAHYAGLICSGLYPSAAKYADVMTSTTHKTLRGPRGGLMLSNNPELYKKLNSAIFPGLQGGPLMHVIAAKAVAFGECLKPEFKSYSQQVIKNAQALAEELIRHDFNLISGGTDCHLMLVSLISKNVSGKDAERSMENAGLTCNKNTVPNDPRSPFVTSGIRLGTPAGTTRGFKEKEFTEIGSMISEVVRGLQNNYEDNSETEQKILSKVENLCKQYPIY